jgi:presenilin 1
MLLPIRCPRVQCYKVIYAYMGFAMFNVFFFLTGALIIQLLRLSGVHMDLVSFCFLLFNFSVRLTLRTC